MASMFGTHAIYTIDTNTYFKSQVALAIALRDRHDLRPVCFFPRPYPQRSDHIRQLQDLGVDAVSYSGCGELGMRLSPAGIVFRLLRKMLPPLAEYWHVSSISKAWRNLLKRRKPSVVVLPAQGRFDQPILGRVVLDAGITLIVCPLWMAGPHELYEALRGTQSQNLRRWINRIVARYFPQWKFVDVESGDSYLALPWGEVLVREAMGFAEGDPWVLHSGPSDFICVESLAMKTLGSRSGLPSEKMHVTGSIFHDHIWECNPLIDITSTGYQTQFPVPLEILTALPPDMFGQRGEYSHDFSNYDDLVVGWLSDLCSLENVRVLASIHPTARILESWMERFPSVTWTECPVEFLIPNCDLYAASISATIQWALASGKPVINFDVYGYGYADYDGESNVSYCTTRNEYQQALQDAREIILNGDSSRTVRLPKWGLLDGHAVDRIHSLMKLEIESSNSPFSKHQSPQSGE